MRAKDSGGRVEGECEDVVTPVRGVARLRGGGVGEARERATSSSKPRRSGGGGLTGGLTVRRGGVRRAVNAASGALSRSLMPPVVTGSRV